MRDVEKGLDFDRQNLGRKFSEYGRPNVEIFSESALQAIETTYTSATKNRLFDRTEAGHLAYYQYAWDMYSIVEERLEELQMSIDDQTVLKARLLVQVYRWAKIREPPMTAKMMSLMQALIEKNDTGIRTVSVTFLCAPSCASVRTRTRGHQHTLLASVRARTRETTVARHRATSHVMTHHPLASLRKKTRGWRVSTSRRSMACN